MTICPSCGCEFEIRPAKGRSSQANRYYFGVVIKAFSEHTGYERDEMHELLAMKFLRIEDDPLTGAPRRKRTPKCDTAEFHEYVERCRRFAASELGISIPDPNEAPGQWTPKRRRVA